MNFYRRGALVVLLVGIVGAPSAFSQYVPGGPKLRGTITSPDGHNCSRRIGADPNADVVWVALYCADKIAKIDIHTHQVTQYALPHKYSYPYGVVVDNVHNVWINLNNADMLAKFDPATGTFTEYQMPSRGTVMRHLAVNNTVSPPEIIAPETGLNKVARIQFRKASDMQ